MDREDEKKKYEPHMRGMFPALSSYPKAPAFKTREFFGGDNFAFREVIVSQELYARIQACGLKGAQFKPLAGQ